MKEYKKTERRNLIQRSAVELFKTRGFEETTMEDIAAGAGLAVGTLYNYFPSKGAILLSIILDRAVFVLPDEDQRIFEACEKFSEAVEALFDNYLKSFSFYHRNIWKEFVGAGIAKDPSLMAAVWKVDALFNDQFARVVQHFIDRGELNNVINVKSTVDVFYSIVIFHIIQFLADDTLTLKALKKSMIAQARVVMRGLVH